MNNALYVSLPLQEENDSSKDDSDSDEVSLQNVVLRRLTRHYLSFSSPISDDLVNECDPCLNPRTLLFGSASDSVGHNAAAACWYYSDERFIRRLLSAGLDPNASIPTATIMSTKPSFVTVYNDKGKIAGSNEIKNCNDITLLHLAAGIGNWKIVRVLLQNSDVNVNVEDSHKNTPLHYCAMARYQTRGSLGEYENCARLLLSNERIDLKKTNRNSLTAFKIASQCGNLPVLRTILQHKKSGTYLLSKNDKRGTELDRLAECEPGETKNDDLASECAKFLVENYGVDPNAVTKECTAIHKAARSSNVSVLKILMEHSATDRGATGKNGNNVLHYAVDKPVRTSKELSKTIECLDYLVKECKIDINGRNKRKETPLHIALLRKNQEIALHLLNLGACVNDFSEDGNRIVDFLSPDTLNSYFDRCIHMKKERYERNCSIVYEYKFLSRCPEDTACNRGEMNLISHIARSDHAKHLLSHPLLTSFLCLKYHGTSMFRWVSVNVILYLLFLVSLNGFIATAILDDDYLVGYMTFSFRIVTCGSAACLLIREVIQAITDKIKYFTSFGNWIEISLFVSTLVLQVSPSVVWKESDMVLIILILSWMEFVHITGKLPVFSVQFQMLKTVLQTFFFYMLWYFFIIIGFAMCFFVLSFRQSVKIVDDKNVTDKPFQYPWLAIEKSLVMMTGEFDYDDVQMFTMSFLSHLVFISFVLIISIVLLNLLHGLAVHDTQAIIDEATVLSVAARVKEIEKFERVFSNVIQNFGSFFKNDFFGNVFCTHVFKKEHVEKLNTSGKEYFMQYVFSITTHCCNFGNEICIRKINPSIIDNTLIIINRKMGNTKEEMTTEIMEKIKELRLCVEDVNTRVLNNNLELQQLKESLYERRNNIG